MMSRTSFFSKTPKFWGPFLGRIGSERKQNLPWAKTSNFLAQRCPMMFCWYKEKNGFKRKRCERCDWLAIWLALKWSKRYFKSFFLSLFLSETLRNYSKRVLPSLLVRLVRGRNVGRKTTTRAALLLSTVIMCKNRQTKGERGRGKWRGEWLWRRQALNTVFSSSTPLSLPLSLSLSLFPSSTL